MQFLRSVADLQGGFQHRATLMDANYRDAMRGQHTEFTGALERFSLDIQKRLWADLERIRLDYERLIYSELKTIRQRAAISGVSAPSASREEAGAAPSLGFDYGRFAERFRGTEEYVEGRPAVLSGLLPRLPQRARYRLRPRRIPGNDEVRGRSGQGHRSQPGIGGHLPFTRSSMRKSPTCSSIWKTCRKPRWMAYSARRWWSICRRIVCPR